MQWRFASAGRRVGAALMLSAMLASCGGGGGGGGSAGSAPTDPGTPAGSGPRSGADYFPLNLDDRWFYAESGGAVSSARVIGSQAVSGGTAMVVRTTDADGTGTDLYLKAANGVTLLPAADADPVTAALGPLQVLRLPLAAGDRWLLADKTLAGVIDLDGDGQRETLAVRAEATVIGFEAVSTPAGDYTQVAHVRTVVTQQAKLSGNGQTVTVTSTSDDWFAPDVGPVMNRLVTTSGAQTTTTESRVTAWRAGSQRSESVTPTLGALAPKADTVVGGCCVALSATFSEAMDTSPEAAAFWQVSGPDGKPVPGQVSWSADGRTATFAPSTALASGRYGAAITTAAQDRVGNALAAPTRWEFTVDASGPAVTPVRPQANAEEVPLDSPVVFTLDEDIDPATVNTATVTLSNVTRSAWVDVKIAQNGRTVTLTPATPLKAGDQYGVNVIGVADLYGNRSSASWTFYADPGRFARPVALVPATVPVTASAIGRLASDGRASLLFATGYGSGATGDFKLLVYRVQADGSASAPQRYDTMAGYGAEVNNLIVADLDGAGHRAVVVGSSGLGIQVFRAQADGSLTLTQTIPTAASYVVRLADLDGDGRLDLIGRPFIGDAVTVWRQGADGSFGAPRSVALPSTGFGDLAVGDLNGDGRPDIVNIGSESLPGQSVGIAYQLADRSFAPVRFIDTPNSDVIRAAVGDVNGDGRADLVLALRFSSSIGVMPQDARGELGAMTVVKSGPSVNEADIADVDGDGRLDVVASAGGGWPVALHRQRSDGTLGGPEVFPSGVYGRDGPDLLAIGDVNGDGLSDIAYAGVWLRQRAVPASAPPAPAALSTPRAKGLGLKALEAVGRR